jgi:carboxylesterase type B
MFIKYSIDTNSSSNICVDLGLAVGAHILSYGGTKPVPFQQAICQSQAMEPGITANYTLNATKAVVDFLGCNTTDLHSVETLSCLRDAEMQAVLDASFATYRTDVHIGDIWLPAVDGDYLPDHPSTLIYRNEFARDLVIMMGWCRDDAMLFTNTNISTAKDTRDFIANHVPALTDDHLQSLLELYPVKHFHANNNLSGEYYRSARIFRDIIMTCQPYYFANRLTFNHNQIYLYEWNQTILDPILEHLGHPAGMGPVHTSEFAYIFGNLSHYNVSGLPFNPSPADYELQVRASRSWSAFASVGRPSLPYSDTFQGWAPAFERAGQVKVFIAGGPTEGISYIEGPQANPVFAGKRLRQRCEYWDNSVVKELQW